MLDARGAITAHYIAHWGVPREIRIRRVAGIEHFAILEFAPRAPRATWRYATNGMSSYAQRGSEHGSVVRTELYASSLSQLDWVDELLASLAAYPLSNHTYFAEGDSVANERPINQCCSPFTGVFLARPGALDPPTIGLIGDVPDKVLVHEVVGLLPSEVSYARQFGRMGRLSQILEGVQRCLDRPRAAIA